MEPGNATTPVPETGGQPASELSPQSFEIPGTPAPERTAPAEQRTAPSGGGPALPPVVPQPLPVAAQPDPAVPVVNPLPVTDDNPQIANDVDVIEKEWVDKAKNIVAKTKDDPYRQNREVSVLRADYMKKRYGKQMPAPEADEQKTSQ